MKSKPQIWTLILPHQLLKTQELLVLSKEDHHYLRSVLRLSEGAQVEISNGIGTKAVGECCVLNKKEAHVLIKDVLHVPEPQKRVHLILGQLKPSALEEAVKLTSEVGVSSIHIFCAEHTASKQRIKLEKLQKIAYESLRVSKSAFVSKIKFHENLLNCLKYLQKKDLNSYFVFCDEEISSPITSVTVYKNKKDLFVLIGPEASFSEAERTQIKSLSNLTSVSLGPNILRAPTAAVCSVFGLLRFVLH